eukprot:COSAG01_NODE_2348_length_7857_cov_4.460299_7_plen_51_part_00
MVISDLLTTVHDALCFAQWNDMPRSTTASRKARLQSGFHTIGLDPYPEEE